MPVNAASKSISLPKDIAEHHYVQFHVFSRLVASSLAEINEHLKEHLQYMGILKARGVLPISGPFFTEHGENTGNGFYVLRVESIDEARRIAADDPLHKLGVRTATIEPWLQVVD